MKDDLIALIDSIDKIEKFFHPIGGKNIPTFYAIHDTQEFQDWVQELNLELQDIYDRTKDHFIWETQICCSKRMDGLNDKKRFFEITAKLRAIRKNIDKYYPDGPVIQRLLSDKEYEQMADRKPKIFISHSSKDVNYVDKIVKLLDGMGLDQTKVFCSSLPGYGIPIGTDIFDYLRDQFLEYDLHVIFIHSDNYYQSPVSLNEMGAAWALKNVVTSILLPDFGFDEMAGVVNNREIAIKLDGEELELKDKLNQLHSKIVEEFGLTKKADIIWEQKRDAFISEVKQINKDASNGKLSQDAESLLNVAASDSRGQILKTTDLSAVTFIQGGSTVMNKKVSQRESARWIAALEELVNAGFIVQVDKNGQVFQVTDAGYKHTEI